MKKSSPVILAVLFIVAGQAVGNVWYWPPSYTEIVPEHPASRDVVAITLGGEWSDSCVPNASSISVIGNNIYFDVILDYPPSIQCLMMITPWRLTRSVGPLPTGTYTVYARLGDPYVPPEYITVAGFIVTAGYSTYYVNAADGNDLNDGLTPETAFATIQKGVNTADSGDTVIVLPGVYTGPGNRDIDFLGKAVTVRSTDPYDPNVVVATIVDCNGGWLDGHRGFHFHSGEHPDSVISGLTITNGYADSGGGIFCDSSNPTITKCSIEMNHAFEGGGVYCINAFFLQISSSSIAYNSAGKGGGIYSDGTSTVASHCYISDNVADFGGGFHSVNSNATLSYCTFRGNHEHDVTDSLFTGGGGVLIWNGSAEVDHCTFTGNSTQSTGGGLSVSSSCQGGEAEVANCTFAYNRATSGGAASAKGCHSCRISIRNCIIWANEPVDDPGVYRRSYGFCGHPNIYVESSIIQAPSDDSHVQLTNCIIADPCFADPGYWDPNGTLEDVNDDFFVDGDYHLKSQAGRWDPNSQAWLLDDVNSPAIDAGDPNSDWTSELWPHGKRINMGAFGGTPQASMSLSDEGNIADLDNNDFVDFNDLMLYTGKWLNQQLLLPEDLNKDGAVDFADFATFAENWP